MLTNSPRDTSSCTSDGPLISCRDRAPAAVTVAQRAYSCLIATEGCRVAPGDCSPEALTRTGLGGFHHPALPLMWLMAMRPRFARESEALGPLPFECLVT